MGKIFVAISPLSAAAPADATGKLTIRFSPVGDNTQTCFDNVRLFAATADAASPAPESDNTRQNVSGRRSSS